MFAGRRNRGGSDYIGIERAGLRGIDGSADRADFTEAHLGDGIEEPRIDLKAFSVDNLRSGWDVNAGADRGDFAVLDDQSAVFDWRTGKSEDFRVSDRVDGGRLLGER